ncbi:MAG: glycoside hydrolase family 57 [Armatimonadetes bacterium]|nr:glycoside hydrolase family 57 [Gemmatimonadales bacterium]NIO75903.1 glycoside hydrolase family 57 [Armatimonadota bacterium]
MPDIGHALGFHMHQPPGNLELLWHTDEWEARQIMLCYQRPIMYAQAYRDHGCFHVDFSGILLEQFLDPTVKGLYRDVVDIEEMLAGYAEAENIELLSTGYFHPVFPLIPTPDWEEHMQRSVDMMVEIFGRRPRGFWPPEMAFSMDMIPALVKAGFEYVVVDHVHVSPEEESLGEEDAAVHPYLARRGEVEITVVPRHRDISNAQESGLDPGWLVGQVQHWSTRIKRPALLTTWSDGENGGWFRQTAEEAGFWGHFYAPYMESIHRGAYLLRPTLISRYLSEHPAHHTAEVRTGAWNVGMTGGFDFAQWAGSPTQKAVLKEVWHASQDYRYLRHHLDSLPAESRRAGEPEELVRSAHEDILRAETSCYFFWGDTWTPKARELVESAKQKLQRARQVLGAPEK